MAAKQKVHYLSSAGRALKRTWGVVVHNHIYPVQGFGERGSRSWIQEPDYHGEEGGHRYCIEQCDCGWFPELGTHYRVVGVAPVDADPITKALTGRNYWH